MNIRWRTRAVCDDCGVVFDNIDPRLIVGNNETNMYWILCPCCLNMKRVEGVTEIMKKQIFEVDANINGEELLDLLCARYNKDPKAKRILDEIRKQRTLMYQAPIRF